MSDSLHEQLVAANHILVNEGIFRVLGHVSVRSPAGDTMLISRSKAPKLVTEDDIIEVTFDERDPRTYSESIIHRAIYRNQPEVNAVVHHHADAIMPFAITETPIRPVFPPGVTFRSGVPVFSDYDDDYGYLVVTEEEGERMAHQLSGHRAQLLSCHGANVVGDSVKQAVILTMYLVQNADYQSAATQLGEPNYYTGPSASVSGTEEMVLSDNVINRMWDYFTSEL